jgi:hypothetical protein
MLHPPSTLCVKISSHGIGRWKLPKEGGPMTRMTKKQIPNPRKVVNNQVSIYDVHDHRLQVSTHPSSSIRCAPFADSPYQMGEARCVDEYGLTDGNW